MADLDPRLTETLKQLSALLTNLADDWWLFGSAAMALAGARPTVVGDVDLLLSRADAARLLERMELPVAPGTKSERFHSEIYGRWTQTPLDVEVLAGFRVRTEGDWREVRLRTRQPVILPFATFYVPEVAEMIELCRLFGRTKDREREQLLRRLL